MGAGVKLSAISAGRISAGKEHDRSVALAA
jgi:hypothetical protein